MNKMIIALFTYVFFFLQNLILLRGHDGLEPASLGAAELARDVFPGLPCRRSWACARPGRRRRGEASSRRRHSGGHPGLDGRLQLALEAAEVLKVRVLHSGKGLYKLFFPSKYLTRSHSL